MKGFILFVLIQSCFLSPVYSASLPLQRLILPKEFVVDIYASPVPNARSMALGEKDVVFVGTLTEGKVYAILPPTLASSATRVITLASGLTMPNGVAFHKGSLYVAERQRILRFDNIMNHLNNPPKPVVILNNLPDKMIHGWRYIGIGPDEKMYVAIGMPCNVCLEADERFGTIMRMDLDGKNVEIYAKGIRNSVGFDWDKRSGALWFTENGRDMMGDDLPPDKLDVASEKGLHFGFPFYDGKNLENINYADRKPNVNFSSPAYAFPAHVAPLGMRFYTEKQFPTPYHHAIFVAEHGSWNRSKKVGYQIIAVQVEGHVVKEVKPFISGWLQGQTAWGRPVDVLVLSDGALLISDDHANVIYRVRYLPSNTVPLEGMHKTPAR